MMFIKNSLRQAAFRWLVLLSVIGAGADTSLQADDLDAQYSRDVVPLLQKYCYGCHAKDVTEAELDLTTFRSTEDLRKHVTRWVKIREMLDTAQMPPPDADQPTDAERRELNRWVHEFLKQQAAAFDGDPGPVVLRRLSNAEYNYSVQDLTGVPSLHPTREFPVDGAAGEGFTNTGSAQGMSPSLVQKYLEAAKEVAQHAALFPRGIRFSPLTTQRDLTDDLLDQIRRFYGRYTTSGNGTAVNLQGIQFETNQGGVLPVAEYLRATIEARDDLQAGRLSVAEVAEKRRLSPVYLQTLWDMFQKNSAEPHSLLLGELQEQWRQTTPETLPVLIDSVMKWQPLVWKFNVVGHLGREGSPQSWMQPIAPVTDRQEFRIPLSVPPGADDIEIHLSATRPKHAGDQAGQTSAIWQTLQLEGGGRPAVPLSRVQGVADEVRRLRRDLMDRLPNYLRAVADLKAEESIEAAAERFGVESSVLRAFTNYLKIGGPVDVQGHFTEKMTNGSGYDFISGWHTAGTASVNANSSDQQVRVPGIARPHGITVHPWPTVFAAVGWASPIDGVVTVQASLSDAHPECGNGIEWFLQHRTSHAATGLAKGEFERGGSSQTQPLTVAVRRGELVTLIVGPRQREHTCDLTAVDLTISETGGQQRVWDASKDLSGNILAANPHADSHGNAAVWHMYYGSMDDVAKVPESSATVPAGSLLAEWAANPDAEVRELLTDRLKALLRGDRPTEGAADQLLYDHLHQLPIAIDDALIARAAVDRRFGVHPAGRAMGAGAMAMPTAHSEAFRIPAALAAGSQLVAVGTVDSPDDASGLCQLHVGAEPVTADGLRPGSVLCRPDSTAAQQARAAMADFGNLFPYAVCYTKIVPVDEVVTATLFHREDDLFRTLLLNADETSELNQLWDDLLFVSEEPLKFVVSVEQIREFATQDRQDMVNSWDQMIPVAKARAEEFRRRQREMEPVQLESAIDLAQIAWRRPISEQDRSDLRSLYARLRDADLPHDESVRLVIAGILTSPAFLYRHETVPDGDHSAEVSGGELASRLSAFLWSSLPDRQLRDAGDSDRLKQPEVLLQETQRMLADEKTRRLAIHFACQWLHVRDFDQNDDKNERLYPEFSELRDEMYEETVRFFEDMFRSNGSILDLLNADHTFLNEALANHYGIPGITGPEWRRVDGIRSHQRGGLLTMATVLASQSGASRTSPILRGNWLSETLLGEKLPKPPPGVPVLPETLPEGLTARQLIERHSSDAACARCHLRIDPYGFAMEQYDAIGRLRPQPAETATTLFEGPHVDGADGLRTWLATERRDDVVRQFCRKLLGYALGREVLLSDEPLLDRMVSELQKHDFRFHTAVELVVTSRQFRQIRGRQQASPEH
ncbi:MAG: DUF1592 domain-containing protein [Planctomycetaceae bacterium]